MRSGDAPEVTQSGQRDSGPAARQGPQKAASLCSEGAVETQPPVELMWAELSGSTEKEVSAAGNTLVARAVSHAERPVAVRLRIVLNHGKGERSEEESKFTLAPGESRDIPVDLRAGLAGTDEYSGRAKIYATVLGPEGAITRTKLEPAFFHRKGKGVRAYNRKALEARFRGGDLRRRGRMEVDAREARIEAGDVALARLATAEEEQNLRAGEPRHR
jgi:hypothetical protein